MTRLTAAEFVAACKADKCSTQSRSKNGQKYYNKYTKALYDYGIKGINSKGQFTKKYSYGVVGHCCSGVEAHFIWAGLQAFVPKNKGYIFNTNVYRKWLMTEPIIEGFGKVDWVTNPASAKLGAVAFKGDGVNKKSATHTCIFISFDGTYVTTIDFNVSDGKGNNNGTIKKRHKKYFLGFANMPYPTKSEGSKKITSERLEVGKTYMLLEDMALRTGASTNANKVKETALTDYAKKHMTAEGLLAKGTRISFTEVWQDSKGAEWVKLASGYMCGIGSKGKYFIELAAETSAEPKAEEKAETKKNYACFPMKVLRFSAIWNTSTAHKKCSGGSPCDYPTDLVGESSSDRMWMYNKFGADMVVLRKYTKASHALWLRTKEKVYIPCSNEPVYLYMMVEHQDNSEMKAANSTYKVGEKIVREGRNGNCTGFHLHCSFGYSTEKYGITGSAKTGTGWKKNSKGGWVMYIKGVKNIKIFEALYVDGSFTEIRDKRHTFKVVPKE